MMSELVFMHVMNRVLKWYPFALSRTYRRLRTQHAPAPHLPLPPPFLLPERLLPLFRLFASSSKPKLHTSLAMWAALRAFFRMFFDLLARDELRTCRCCGLQLRR